MNGQELIDMHDSWSGIGGALASPPQLFGVKLAQQSSIKVCTFLS